MTKTWTAGAVKLRRAMNLAGGKLDDASALEAMEIYPMWAEGTAYFVNDRVRYGELLYRCVQGHTSQADWAPDAVPALWVVVSVAQWPEWVQPLGSTDAYALGAKVSHNDKHWVSTVDNNTWEPGVYGWEEQA